ncbi:protein LONGIFOLIA 1-like [Euphorbia lathyris]|uniref:protein LONGIFOLIA 1-like n=1 Tax=Euphorbia lathyris TaxID=212925 RepID=UPI0033135363
MSSKVVRSFSDENPDLHKQIGCMNGIFQLFDRHHFLSGRRQITHTTLPPGQSRNSVKDSKNASKNNTETNHKKTIKEKQRISTESSRTSFSSSTCSSSLSSIECNRASHLETCSISQNCAPEIRVQDSPTCQQNASSRSNQQSPDLRDVVKGSIYREARGLLVKTVSKGENGGQTLKYFDSPRPMQQTNASGLKESFQVLHKLQQSPRKSGERNHFSPLKDARRYSCDGRESRDVSKSVVKLKELPRLSLDSRAGSIRGSTTERKSDNLLGNSEKINGNSAGSFNQQEEPESRTRLSNVVAKLMGLEAFPDAMSTVENQMRQINRYPDAENKTDENKQTRILGSPRNLHKEPLSPQLRNDAVKKPAPSSKLPIEPAPWKQPDGSSKSRVAPPKSPNTPLSVYGEIEKRLAQLEFKKSGKDLRALKQILEAMHKTKEILETRNEAANLGTQRSSNSSLQQNLNLSNLSIHQYNNPISAPTKSSDSPKSCRSPIVIMKPGKLAQRASNTVSSENATESPSLLQGLQNADSADTRKDSIAKRNSKESSLRTNELRDRPSLPSLLMDKNCAARLTRLSQNPKGPHSTTRESTNSDKSLGTFNVRQPLKKLGLEKQTQSASASSDSIKRRRQVSRQPTESGSPRRLPRSRPSSLQPSDDELSEIGSDARDLSYRTDSISIQSESTSLASQVDEEVSSIDRSNKINYNIIQQSYQRQKPVARSVKDRSNAELTIPSSEQPSPVSVLDATFHADDLPSPIKKKSIAFKDDDVEWNPVDANHSYSVPDYSLNSVINHTKTKNIHLPLINNCIQMLSSQKEHFLGEYSSVNPDHQYISEILLASGFLNDLESGSTTIHLRQTGYPINPDIFLALEQVKTSAMFSNDKESRTKTSQSKLQSNQRKLVFDVVNEILINKILLENPSKHRCSPNTLVNQRPRGQQILGELCSEVDRLQGNASNFSLDGEDDAMTGILQADLMHQSTHWTASSSEIPGLVLDVERLIFKDLITEVVNCETLGLGVQSAGRCRQLFSK